MIMNHIDGTTAEIELNDEKMLHTQLLINWNMRRPYHKLRRGELELSSLAFFPCHPIRSKMIKTNRMPKHAITSIHLTSINEFHRFTWRSVLNPPKLTAMKFIMIYIVYRLLIEYAGILYADCYERHRMGDGQKSARAKLSERFEVSIDVE